ncbi:hypothetical protein [Paracraurococcus lichenis]|uniref:Uncharacterized protein n=1 Tax=Paracraurococcus lichenis TaxID=3064888 RepID=A0ABT9E4J6_9PROT|nr:hypothetical protein [Paracraurococcus sp. LOR1-02]MDO9711059.1 hypothetical protein [Paracraurococcus sp. LOR1-02]
MKDRRHFIAVTLGGAIMATFNPGNGDHPGQAAAQGNMPDGKMFVDAVTAEMNRYVAAMARSASSNNYRMDAWQISSTQVGDPEPWGIGKEGISNTTYNTTFYPVRAQTTFTYVNGRTEQKRVLLYCFYNSFREFSCATVRPWEW